MNSEDFSVIVDLITLSTGIIPRDSHKTGIYNYIQKRSSEIEKTDGIEHLDYLNYLKLNKDEMVNLINNATVNETYFFREEAQFEILRNKVLPELNLRNNGQVNIWSAAASSGEEIYSLYLLAKSMNIKAECFASDINTHVLEICEKGIYRKNSIRSVDGSSFLFLLEPYKKEDGSFELPKEITSQITRKRINLSKMIDYPLNQDIIFIRNVFIYFSLEMKKQILQKIVSECLNDGGYLFVSMNEVASIDSSIIPKELEKCSDGNIFYFHKRK